MVHGGGEHHSGGGSSGYSAHSSSWTSSQNSSYQTWNESNGKQSLTREGGHDDCDECCCCCVVVFGFLGCTSTSTAKNRIFGSSLFGSLLLFFLLWGFSSLDQEWILNSGETLRLPKNVILTTTVSIEANPRDLTNIYAMKKCPKLSGPPVDIQDSQELTLPGVDDFQFDYFYLTKGSAVTLNVTATQGSFQVYLLRGMPPDEDDEDDYQDALRSNKVVKTFVSQDSSYAQATLSIPSVKHEGFYTFWYDNASSAGMGRLRTDFNIHLTTYDLEGQNPIHCESSACLIPYHNCILVQTASTHPPPPEDAHTPFPPLPGELPKPPHPYLGGRPDDQPPLPEDGPPQPHHPRDEPPHPPRLVEVHVRVHGHRKWRLLVGLSAIPLIVGLFCMVASTNSVTATSEPVATAVPLVDETIPLVTADSVHPSAPPEKYQYT